MSLPAAAPVAILVLAWDETTPAVRALVAATTAPAPTVDSVVVVVPSGTPGSTEPTQEEFLPLAVTPDLLTLAPLAAAATEALKAVSGTGTTIEAGAPEPAELPGAEAEPQLAGAPEPTVAELVAAPASPERKQLLPALPAPLEVAGPPLPLPPVWAAVRVLRLSSFNLRALAAHAGQALPAPVWTGAATAPTAPYAGSDSSGSEVGAEENNHASLAQITVAQAFTQLKEIAPSASQAVPQSAFLPIPPQSPASVSLPPLYLPSELPRENSDLEADYSLAAAEPELPPEPADLLAETADFLVTNVAPAHAGWPEALAALRQPAATSVAAASPENTEAPPTPPAQPEHPALRAVAGTFEAPNLNFQVIQYARFAVPLALAEAAFAAIYAPAWPTWLAAQELRQRTGRPLVLHVSTLAAADASVATATGWQAELQRQALYRADLILTETPALAQRLRHDLGLAVAAVRAVPAADAAAVAQALATVRARPTANQG